MLVPLVDAPLPGSEGLFSPKPSPPWASEGQGRSMLRAVAVCIIIAIIGVGFIVANPQDPGVKAFGWSLVLIGSGLAAAFTALWARDQTKRGAGGTRGAGSDARGRRSGKKGG